MPAGKGNAPELRLFNRFYSAMNVEALAHFLGDSEAKLAFVSPSSLDKFRAVCERLGRRIPVVILRDGARAIGFARFED